MVIQAMAVILMAGMIRTNKDLFNFDLFYQKIDFVIYFLFVIKIKMQETPSKVSLYIPRLLGSIKQQHIKNAFHELNIGNVYYIDMHYRVNEKSNPYYFAFLSMQPYKTKEGILFYNNIINGDKVRVIYDFEKFLYWEVKLHMQKENRFIDNKPDVIDYTKGLEKEYDDIQREIFTTVLTP